TKFGIENHPNPFNPSTEIRYQLPQAEEVNIVIYNVLGQQVRELVNRKQEAGSYVVKWNGDNEQGLSVPSGMYFLRMKAGSFIANRKLLLLK
ncbi:MAG: T9SS type A sorting domain-containing protein, partial [Aliifodinibius sp.]|nr:T9SS type A sorting domain-containing protein [Fodinibius sp.]NIV10186.1 T9SS type A sorting domain-containing protein [Fodinibius sp.]NIY23801.1 T9SS type A sorting domain-containing protein [Fodinibius sp.]